MTKNLISMISTVGKTPEQVAKEAWDAFKQYRATQRNLKKCKICGEYKKSTVEYGEKVIVTCICDGILCTKCKLTKIRRPISNHYDEDTDELWHTPWFLHICSDCRK